MNTIAINYKTFAVLGREVVRMARLGAGCDIPTLFGVQQADAVSFSDRKQDNIDFMFGDSGVGHIYVCSNHPDKPAFY